MSRVLIHNFDYPFWHLAGRFFHYSDCNSELRKHPNVRIVSEDRGDGKQIISDFLNALLTNDKICINIDSFLRLIPLLGFNDTQKLLLRGIFEIINDGSYDPIIIAEDRGFSKFSYVCSLETALFSEQSQSSQELESQLNRNFGSRDCKIHLKKYEINSLQLLIEKNTLNLKSNASQEQISNELKYDLGNQSLVSQLQLNTCTLEQISREDIYHVLRLAQLNRGLVYASKINADNLIVESAVRPVLNAKFSPITRQTISSGTIELFKEITDIKGIPDLGKLYISRIISIDDILDLRENFNGRLFRHWINSSDYSEERTLQYVLSKSKPTLRNSIIKWFRWTYPNVIGVIEPVTGIAASLVDSLLVEKVLQGWHPTMFLDDKLRAKIDNRLEEFQRNELRKRVRKNFPYIGRNESCPCGSGKTYKVCCGRSRRGFG